MMSTPEHEIMEMFHQLHPAAKQRVRALIDRETAIEAAQADSSAFDFSTWWTAVETLQADIRSRIGKNGTIGALSLLEELRDEAS